MEYTGIRMNPFCMIMNFLSYTDSQASGGSHDEKCVILKQNML